MTTIRPIALRERMAAVAAGICGHCESTLGTRYTFEVEMPKSVADIGCDHGKLAVWLSENTDIKIIIAADKNPLPLEKAAKLAKKHGAKITVKLSDGLQNIEPNEAELVTISGMSGITMTEILGGCEWLHERCKRLVLLPACKSSVIETWLTEHDIDHSVHSVTQGKKHYNLILGEIKT